MEEKSNGAIKDSWAPQSFEEEMQSIQPDYDLVMDLYSPGPATLLGPLENETNNISAEYDVKSNNLPEDNIDIQKETLMMMRNCGFESDLGGYLNNKQTLPTHQTKLKTIYDKDMPVLLDDEFFKFKPAASMSNSSSANSTTNENSSSANSTTNEDGQEKENEEQSPLYKILGINRKYFNPPPLEEQYMEDFPDFNYSMQIKNKKKLYTPKNLYNIKKKT